jgi:hypothetical protein
MLKTFTLDNRIDEKLSDTEGTVIFFITDENGQSRKVFGDTFLDESGVPQGVTAGNKRELPLVEALFRMDVDESTEIDFTLFNKVFNREINKTKNQVAFDTVLEMEKEKGLLHKLGKVLKVGQKEHAPTS